MPQVGGVARRATVIKEERSRGDAVLVLDVGDSLTGDLEPALSSEGASSIEAMNLLGYDAAALGPLDLSLGPETLKQRIGEAKFPFLSADMTVTATGAPVAESYAIREVAGRRIAIAGLTAASTMNGFKAADPFEAAKRVVEQVAGQADALILLSHAAPEVNERIADEIPGIAAILEGGATYRAEPFISARTGTPIYHADQPASGHAGRVLGVATLRIENGKLLSQKWRALSLGPEIRSDQAMLEWAQEQRR